MSTPVLCVSQLIKSGPGKHCTARSTDARVNGDCTHSQKPDVSGCYWAFIVQCKGVAESNTIAYQSHMPLICNAILNHL